METMEKGKASIADENAPAEWSLIVVTDGEIFAVERVTEILIKDAGTLSMRRLEDGTIYLCEPTK